MTFPVRRVGSFQKPSKGDRLRTAAKAINADKRTLAALYRYVYRRDSYRCVACGRVVVVGAIEELKRAHPHHIVPRSLSAKAATHTKTNVVTVCPFCHSDIHDHKLFISGNAEKTLRIRWAA